MAAFPSTLPPPEKTGYSIAPGDPTIRTDMEVGPARVRRRTSSPPDQISLAWKLSDAEMAEFSTFFSSPVGAAGGAAWFNIDLAMGRNPAQTTLDLLQKLTAADAATGDFFGFDVALSADGSVLAVGARQWEGATGSQRGGVYIYDRSGTSWVQRGAVLTPSDAANTDYFGTSVALSSNGEILVVGATHWEGTVTDQGGVYIFDWSGSAWVQRGSVLTAADAATTDLFGYSVSISGDGLVLAVGAYQADHSSLANPGAVYTYTWSGSAWVLRGKIVAGDAGASDYFGFAVALNETGNILAVGASAWDGSFTDQGGVYIYDWTTVWTQRGAVIQSPRAQTTGYFGRGLDLSGTGEYLLVGEYLRDADTVADNGAAYLLRYTGAAWVLDRTFEAPEKTSMTFGNGVAMADDQSLFAIGAPNYDLPPLPDGANFGAVFSYDGTVPVFSGGGIQTVEARFRGPYQANLEPGLNWAVSATLEVRRA